MALPITSISPRACSAQGVAQAGFTYPSLKDLINLIVDLRSCCQPGQLLSVAPAGHSCHSAPKAAQVVASLC